jgi:hypothetical protein
MMATKKTKKTKKMDPSEIEKVISAIRDREVDSTVPAPDQIQIRNLRNGLQKQLAPIFERAGLDLEELSRIRRQHHQDLRKLVEEHKSQAKTHRAAQAEKMRAALAQRSSVLNSIANQPIGSIWNLSPIQKAWFITAEPVGMLFAIGNVDAFGTPDNWAEIAYENSQDTSGTSVYVRFYFVWENPFPYAVVLNADTELVVVGTIEADANWALFGGGSSSISLWANLDVYVGGVDITSYYSNERDALVSVTAHGGDLFDQGTSPNVEFIIQPGHLWCQPIPVDAGQAVVFVVSMRADIKINNGSVDLSFSNTTPKDYFVVNCPGVTLQLLSGGPVNAPPLG